MPAMPLVIPPNNAIGLLLYRYRPQQNAGYSVFVPFVDYHNVNTTDAAWVLSMPFNANRQPPRTNFRAAAGILPAISPRCGAAVPARPITLRT